MNATGHADVLRSDVTAVITGAIQHDRRVVCDLVAARSEGGTMAVPFSDDTLEAALRPFPARPSGRRGGGDSSFAEAGARSAVPLASAL